MVFAWAWLGGDGRGVAWPSLGDTSKLYILLSLSLPITAHGVTALKTGDMPAKYLLGRWMENKPNFSAQLAGGRRQPCSLSSQKNKT